MDPIAICGISGRFPSCNNVEEFKQALLKGDDLINHNHNRWNYKFFNTPSSLGLINDLDKFDAKFFGVNSRQAFCLTPKTRQAIEVAFESIFDAGFSPQEFRGTNTGVFVAIAETAGESYTESATALVANYISFYLDLKGPSLALDASCASSGYALHHAVQSIQCGSCDAALVCGVQLQVRPAWSIELNKYGILSKSGICKTFDDERDGYVRSEAVVSVLLQKSEKARRIYATISGIGTNVDGFKEEGITNPSSSSQLHLLQQIYSKYGLNPDDVEYFDAHGTGTLVGDIKECESLRAFFDTSTRQHLLKIGSVKTCSGHAESSAGIVSLIKLLIIINSGTIPAHIHYKHPALDITSIDSGRLEIPVRNSKYNGGLLALFTFGITGANGHVVIRPYFNIPTTAPVSPSGKRLCLISARTKQQNEQVLDKIEALKDDIQCMTLIDEIAAKAQIRNYSYRGYKIINTDIKEVANYSKDRVICFSYSGMGSHWPKMGRDLMQFEIFRRTIKKCTAALEPRGLNLLEIITNGTANMLDDPEICFPAIISVSVGITDILYALGIKPDLIIGHSLGEIGCGYADGSFTAEEAVLVAHARGLATKNAKLIPGLMASIGLTLEEVETILPENIFVAAHNYKQNITISGPKESVKRFVSQVSSKGIFAKIVKTADIAFHSKYVHDAGPTLLKYFQEIIPSPRARSPKWLSSCISEKENNNPFLTKFNSAEYQYYNFMNPVLFKQVLDQVPDNAVLVEIAPTGLFQAIFRRALNENVTKIELVNKYAEDNYEIMLKAIGRIYISTNIPINLHAINEGFRLPVDGRTAPISPLIQWDHSATWDNQHYVHNKHNMRFVFERSKFEDKYLWENVVNGKPVFPCAGLLFMAWAAKANKIERKLEECPVVIKNLRILEAIYLTDCIEFFVNVLQSDEFEIVNNDVMIAKGLVILGASQIRNFAPDNDYKIFKKNMLNSDDILSEFHLRGFDWSPSFSSIVSLSICGKYAEMKWSQNWIKFMESMLKSMEFHHQDMQLKGIEYISKVEIDPAKQLISSKAENPLKYFYNNLNKTATCGGVQMTGIIFATVKHQPMSQSPNVSVYDFIPNEISHYQGTSVEHLEFSLSMAIQIVIENNITSKTTVIAELVKNEDSGLKEIIFNFVHPKYMVALKYSLISEIEKIPDGTNLLINSSKSAMSLADIFQLMDKSSFVFCKMSQRVLVEQLKGATIFSCSKDDDNFLLLKKPEKIPEHYTIIETSNENFEWITELKSQLTSNAGVVYLVSSQLRNGLIGMYYCLKEELNIGNIKIFIFDSLSICPLNFDLHSKEITNQIQKGLTINIHVKNKWSTYRRLPMGNGNYRTTPQSFWLDFDRSGAKWIESNCFREEKLIDVKYASLNPWDCEHYQTSGEILYAIEFSGKADDGENVVGIATVQCLQAGLSSKFCWKLPETSKLSLEEFATIALGYSIGYIAATLKTLQAGTNILVNEINHISLAFTFFALEFQTKVFVASKNTDAFRMIRNYFPASSKLILLHGDFDNVDFVAEILEKTSGVGFNAIFSTEERNLMLNHSEILTKGGTVITVHRDHLEIDKCVLNSFTLKGFQIYRINLKTLLDMDESTLNQTQMAIQYYLNANQLKPFPFIAKSANDLEGIVEYLESKPCHKLVVNVDSKCFNPEAIQRKIYFHPQKSYVIVGGLGGVGLELIKWLVRKGATMIILNSDDITLNSYKMYLLHKFNENGIRIYINNYDATTLNGAKQLLDAALSFAPVGGIFSLAINLKPQLFINTSPRDFHQVVAPQLHISENLSKLSQMYCSSSLDHFVVFSATAALGAVILSSFGYACSSLEMLCQERHSKGLPALAVQWGWIGDVGYVKENKMNENKLDNLQSIFSCLETLEKLMLQNNAVAGSVVYKLSGANIIQGNNGVLPTIASILGAKNENDLEHTIPLVNLGIDSVSVIEIGRLLKNDLGIEMASVDIRKLTLRDIKNLGVKNTNN